jgi:hypothetical protein
MPENVIYSSQFRFYVERVIREHRRHNRCQHSEAEMIEVWLRQHGVTVVTDVPEPVDLDKGTPVG